MPPGLPLNGKQLQHLSPNMSHDEQMVILNDVIDTLNNVNKDIVAQSPAGLTITFDGSLTQIFTFPHNLGYRPRAEAFLGGVTFTANGVTYPNVNWPLPNSLTFIGGSVGGGGAATVAIEDWLTFFTDTVNFYLCYTNPNNFNAGKTFPFTYFLMREPTA